MERVTDDKNDQHPCNKLNNVSLGGLAFISPQPLTVDSDVKVCFPLLDEHHQLTGRVMWSKPVSQGFEIGLQFDDLDELYRLRMIEQICHIEHYRSEVQRQQGRTLSSEEAAKEWIVRYAGEFPSLKNDH